MPKKKNSELIEKAAAGDARAAAELVGVVYVDKIHAAIYKFYPRYNYPDYREQRDDLASEILMHLITPDSKGNWRLRKLNGSDNIDGYFYRMALHFLIDRHDKMKRRGEIDVDFDEKRVSDEDRKGMEDDCEFVAAPDTPSDNPASPEEVDETDVDVLGDIVVGNVQVYDDVDRKHMAVVEVLNALMRTSPRERYVLATKLLAILVKRTGEVMNLQDKIDATLSAISDEPHNNNIYIPFNRLKIAAARYVNGDPQPKKTDKKKAPKKKGDKKDN